MTGFQGIFGNLNLGNLKDSSGRLGCGGGLGIGALDGRKLFGRRTISMLGI